jgi:ATP-dependent Clp protease protease subunit
MVSLIVVFKERVHVSSDKRSSEFALPQSRLPSAKVKQTFHHDSALTLIDEDSICLRLGFYGHQLEMPSELACDASPPYPRNRSRPKPGRQFRISQKPLYASIPYPTNPLLTDQGGGWRTSDIFSKLLQERIICLNGEVNETLSAAIVAQLLYLESDAPEKAITLYINSPGGSVTAGLAIYDTMTYIRSPVSTVCVGQAASMGSLLLCGGEKGKRFCLPHSSVMVHQPSGGYFGQASDIAIHAQEILRVRKKLNEIFRRHLTKEHTLEDIERLMERDKFLSAEEALEMGIVDEILDRRIKDEERGDTST